MDLELIKDFFPVWGLFLAVSVFLSSALLVLLSFIRKSLAVNHPVLDVLAKTHSLFLIILSFYFGSFFLNLSEEFIFWPYRIMVCALALQGGLWGNELILYLLRQSKLLGLNEDVIASGSNAVIVFVAKTLLWSIVTIFLLSNWGFNVAALLTGLGVGGIAVALAVQNVLGDLFASLSIVIDKPFKIGDFIIVDNFKGRVEHIGLKTTRLRSLSGEQLVFSNADLLKSRIRNFKQMKRRRGSFSFDIVMQTPIEKVEKIPQIVREIVDAIDQVQFERAHFKEIGSSGFNYEVAYYLEKPEMDFYLDVQQRINLDLLRVFEKEEISMAYPTSTVYLTKGE